MWKQTAEMVRLLAELGLPSRQFLPPVSDETLAKCAAADAEGGLDPRTLPKEERRVLMKLYEASAACNQQFEEEEEMLDMAQYRQLVLGLWPAGTDHSASVEEEEEEEEGDVEGQEGEEGEEEWHSDSDDEMW